MDSAPDPAATDRSRIRRSRCLRSPTGREWNGKDMAGGLVAGMLLKRLLKRVVPASPQDAKQTHAEGPCVCGPSSRSTAGFTICAWRLRRAFAGESGTVGGFSLAAEALSCEGGRTRGGPDSGECGFQAGELSTGESRSREASGGLGNETRGYPRSGVPPRFYDETWQGDGGPGVSTA